MVFSVQELADPNDLPLKLAEGAGGYFVLFF